MIDDRTIDLFKIKNKIKLWKKKHRIDIVAIDYMGLMRTTRKYERKDLELDDISLTLKQTAKEMDIPLIILTQENKDGESANSKGPLRDADFWFSISNLADKGIKVWKIEDEGMTYEVAVNPSIFEVRLKANRHGRAGAKMLYEYMPDGTYVEIDYKHEQSIEPI